VRPYFARILACLLASVLLHLLLHEGAERLAPATLTVAPRTVTMCVIEPPPPAPEPPPEPEKAPEPPKPEPAQIVHEAPTEAVKPRPRVPTKVPPKNAKPKEVANSERQPTTGETTDTPTFGTTMESTTQAGSGPTVPIGNTLQVPQKDAPQGKGPVKPLAAPVPVYEVTKMPVMRGRCQGGYTDEARSAAIEGTVVIDLVVREDGTTSDLKVVQGLGHGLDEAALSALRTCKFTPGERQGKPVPVRVRAFKIRFFLQDDP
jgi:protein TonB